MAKENGIKTIAFPAISTGEYGYPIDAATEIAVQTTLEFLEKDTTIDLVRFVCFSSKDEKIYQDKLKVMM